jgi:hypothetical protein
MGIYEKVSELWKNAANEQTVVEKYNKYWMGKPAFLADGDNSGQSAYNVIFQIIEAKLSEILEQNVTLNVIPQIGSFQDLTSMRELQAVADVYQDKLKQILDENHMSVLKERLARQGLIASYSPVQTYFDAETEKGDIKIRVLESQCLRWDKTATSIENATFFAYETNMNPAEVKKTYAKLPDGSWDMDMIEQIDLMTNVKREKEKGARGAVFSYTNDQQGGQQYAYQGGLETVGKTVKIVSMYLLDDSLYSPNSNENDEKQVEKEVWQMKYPNGRIIVFIPDSKQKIVLKDDAVPESFKNIGNVDIFKPYNIEGVKGLSEVEQLIPVQDRINAALFRLRQLIAKYVSIILLDKGLDIDVEENDFVNQFVMFMDNVGRGEGKLPPVLTNNTLSEVQTLETYIDFLKNQAYAVARVNETFVNGMQQTGTSSADQVEALQDSPMASIRLVQRNLVDTLIRVGEKVLTLIQCHCNTQDLLSLTTRMTFGGVEITHAGFGGKTQEDGTVTQNVSLYDKAGKAVHMIEVSPNWKFQVKVIAGNDIPRTRRENATVVSNLFNSGVLGDPQDIDLKEQYLKALDIPNYREFIAISRKKQDELAKAPPKPMYMQILSDPNQSKAASDMLKALEFNSGAKAEFLAQLGFQAQAVDKITDAPAQSIVSKSDVATTATAVPEVISNDPKLADESQKVTAAIMDKKHNIH